MTPEWVTVAKTEDLPEGRNAKGRPRGDGPSSGAIWSDFFAAPLTEPQSRRNKKSAKVRNPAAKKADPQESKRAPGATPRPSRTNNPIEMRKHASA